MSALDELIERINHPTSEDEINDIWLDGLNARAKEELARLQKIEKAARELVHDWDVQIEGVDGALFTALSSALSASDERGTK